MAQNKAPADRRGRRHETGAGTDTLHNPHRPEGQQKAQNLCLAPVLQSDAGIRALDLGRRAGDPPLPSQLVAYPGAVSPRRKHRSSAARTGADLRCGVGEALGAGCSLGRLEGAAKCIARARSARRGGRNRGQTINEVPAAINMQDVPALHSLLSVEFCRAGAYAAASCWPPAWPIEHAILAEVDVWEVLGLAWLWSRFSLTCGG